MKAKKSKKVDVERKRGLFLKIGFAIAISWVILAFQWKVYNTQPTSSPGPVMDTADEEIIDITVQKERESISQTIIIPVKTDEEVPDNQKEIDPSEISPDDSLEFLPPINFVPEPEPVPKVIDIIPFVLVENEPEYPGGDEAMVKFIQSNIKYPKLERDLGIQGKVVISYIINVDGSISNLKIVRGVTPNLNKEAMRVIRLMPKWTPGKQRNRPVRVITNQPFDFILAN